MGNAIEMRNPLRPQSLLPMYHINFIFFSLHVKYAHPLCCLLQFGILFFICKAVLNDVSLVHPLRTIIIGIEGSYMVVLVGSALAGILKKGHLHIFLLSRSTLAGCWTSLAFSGLFSIMIFFPREPWVGEVYKLFKKEVHSDETIRSAGIHWFMVASIWSFILWISHKVGLEMAYFVYRKSYGPPADAQAVPLPEVATLVAPQCRLSAKSTGNVFTLDIRNRGAMRIAFKIKITNRQRYYIIPRNGFMMPNETAVVRIFQNEGDASAGQLTIKYANAPRARNGLEVLGRDKPTGTVVIPIRD